MKDTFVKIKKWLASLSFKTGAIVAAICVMCYILSFMQMLLPVSGAVKGVLWALFFGLAKTCQYTAILILGKAGVRAVAPDIEIETSGASVGVVVQGAAVVEVVEREGVAIDGPLVIPFIAPAVIRIYREVIIVCFPAE